MLKKSEILKRNLDLLNEFMNYAFDNPQFLEKIPPEAELVIIPLNDKELAQINQKMAQTLIKKGKKVVVVEFKKPKPIVPKIEFVSV